jgi:fucose permease
MPMLRTEMHLSYSTASLHFSALAFGLLIAGLVGSKVLAKVAHSSAIWAGSAAVCIAASSIAFSHNPYWTITAALVVGFAGSLAGQAIFSSLVDRQQLHHAQTVAELVVINSLFAASAPIMVAAIVNLHLPWRSVAILPIVIFALICIGTRGGGGRQLSVSKTGTATRASLPSRYWLYFAIVFFTTASEWSIAFWCPEYLKSAHHFSATNACHGLSVFLLAMLGGRVLSTRIASAFPTNQLLIAATALATIGFFLFWCAADPIIIYAGLLLLGLGQSNCYPLALSGALSSAPQRTTEAISKMSISTGLAILLAPLLLGICADNLGIHHSYGIVAVVLLVALLIAIFSLRTQK